MDDNNQEVQSPTPPRNDTKLVAIILVSMLFGIIIGVTLIKKGLFASPTTTVIPTFPVVSQTISITPSTTPIDVPTSTYQGMPNITSVAGCPTVTQNVDDCKKPGCYCLRSIPPEGCPQGFIIKCSSVLNKQ